MAVMKRGDVLVLTRRQFSGLCVTLASLLTSGAPRLRAAEGAAATGAGRTVKLPDGTVISALGQGSARLGQGRRPAAAEEEALRTGLRLGMTVIDTAENYGDGRSEQAIGRVIAGQRERVFLVSKVEADHVAGDGIARACAASLDRLGTDHLDLYLLHWPVPSSQFSRVVAHFESLRAAGKIRAWGVSNFSVHQMQEPLRVRQGDRCAINQVPYSLGDRGIERDLLPWCAQHAIPVMAYSPLGGTGATLLHDPALGRIAAAHGCAPAAVALAWALRSGSVVAIPESGSAAHVGENAAALSLTLTPQDLAALDSAFPPPRR
jgi:diketogulonate reductase-like aldo/keto reductase